MFWKLSFRQPCAIDTLLEKEDCTLEEILDDDNVLQECKSNNKKLTDFLVRPEILEQLVRMVCFEPAEDVQDKVKFKYPHLACELLTSEVFTIIEQLSTSDNLMNMLWEFLDSTTPLNPLLASFVSKVLGMLLNRETNVIVRYIKNKEDFISKFLSHLGTSAIMDLLLQMVAAPVVTTDQSRPLDQTRVDLAQWLLEERIVERLVDFIKDNEEEDSDGEQCVNSALALCEMIRLSRECFQLGKPAPLHEILESKEVVQRLLRNIFSSEAPSDVVVVNGISVLLTMLRDSLPTVEYGVIPSVSDAGVMESPPSPGIANVVEVVVPWLKNFHSLLTRTPEQIPKMSTTIGTLEPPLGNMRLQVAKLLSALLVRNSPAIAKEIVVLDMFNTLIDLFFSFPWNNFLHMQVEQCVQAVLESSQSYSRTGEEEEEEFRREVEDTSVLLVSAEDLKLLREHLLKDCQFVSKLLDGASANDLAKAEQNGRRQGYMGHLVRISNGLVRFGETDEQLTTSLDDDTQQKWNNFVNGPLAEMNKRNETNLGGKQPMSSNMDDSDDEFELGSAGDSELEKAYQQYLDVKYTGSYLEEYGVEDELAATEEPFEESFTRLVDITRVITADEEETQPTSLFDAVCADRVQQFDDEDSDEDDDDDDDNTWADKDPSLSPMDQHNSASSDEEEFCNTRREFPTGDSIEDTAHHLGRGNFRQGRGGVYLKNSPNIITQITSTTASSNDPDKMEIENSFGPRLFSEQPVTSSANSKALSPVHSPVHGMVQSRVQGPGVLSWKSDLATDEDLSGVIPMDTTSGISDWTKEPDNRSEQQKSPQNTWADFSKFPTYGGASRQSREEESTVTPTHSHITVTYITRDMQNSASNDDEDFLEPSERPDTSKYTVLSPYGASQRRDLDPGNIDVSFEGDNRCSDSDEEDLNTSSDSDEERTGHYDVNTSLGSDSEQLVNSLNDSREQEMASSSPSSSPSHSVSPSQGSSHSPSSPSSSRQHDHHSPNGKAAGVADSGGGGDTTSPASQSSRHQVMLDGDSHEKGPVEGDLQDNYAFLSKQGMLSGKGQDSNAESRSILEQKRTEALEACNTYGNEVKVNSQQGSVET